MATLRNASLGDFSDEERTLLGRIAQRQGRTLEELLRPTIGGVPAHWPAWLEANQRESNQSYRLQGKLTQIAKEAIHVAVSMTNNCRH